MIKVRCGKCGHAIGAPDKYAGKTISCPKCKAGIQIPQSSEQAEVRPPNIIKFHCPHCNQKIGLAPEYAGKQVKCAKCKNTMVVPQAASTPKPLSPAEKAVDDFDPFANIPNFDELKQAEQNAPAADIPLQLTPFNEPTQQSEFANMAGRSPASSPGTTGSRGGFQIDNTSIALLASIVFVIIGGMSWGLLAKYTHREFGLLAWGIGVLAGLGIYLFTASRGVFLGVLAALIAFFGILSGKYFIAKWYYMPELMAEIQKNRADYKDPNNVKLSKEEIREIMSDPEQMYELAVMQMAENGKITKEEAEFYRTGESSNTLSRTGQDSNKKPDQAQQQKNDQMEAEIKAKIDKQLAEWNEQEKIKVVKAQYPKMMKEFAENTMKSPIMNVVGFAFAYIAAFSLFDLLWFPIAMVTAYKFGTGESS